MIEFGTKVKITANIKGINGVHDPGEDGVVLRYVEDSAEHAEGVIVVFEDGDSGYVSGAEFTRDLTWLPPHEQAVEDAVTRILVDEYNTVKPKKQRVAWRIIQAIDLARQMHPSPHQVRAISRGD